MLFPDIGEKKQNIKCLHEKFQSIWIFFASTSTFSKEKLLMSKKKISSFQKLPNAFKKASYYKLCLATVSAFQPKPAVEYSKTMEH